MNRKTKYLAILFLAAVAERIYLDLGPNIELVTTALVLSSFYFGKKESFWLTFAIIAISDRFIGNSNIFLFTWTGFLIPALLSKSLIIRINRRFNKVIQRPLTVALTGVMANLFFYLWTNFGVWLLSDMYPKTEAGLLMSYINALPFLRFQLTSTFIFVPLGFIVTEIAIYIIKNNRLNYRFRQHLNFN